MSGRFGSWSVVILLGLAMALGACGRKGDLRPPDGQEDAYFGPGVYPAPDSVVPPGSGSSGGESAGSATAVEPEDEAEGGAEGAASP